MDGKAESLIQLREREDHAYNINKDQIVNTILTKKRSLIQY